MSGKRGSKRRTFAEIVAAVGSEPARIPEYGTATPGRYSGDVLYDPEGHPLHEVDDHALEAEEVRAAVLAGARVVWDSCGCGGYCNALEWPESAALRREAARSAPRFRKNDGGRVTRLAGAGGEVLLVAGGIRWGEVFR